METQPVAITTGTGTDRVRIDADGSATGSPTVFKGAVSVSLSGGIDRLQVGVKGEAGNRATFQQGVLFYGGALDDTLIYGQSRSLSDGSIVSFEEPTLPSRAIPATRPASPAAAAACGHHRTR